MIGTRLPVFSIHEMMVLILSFAPVGSKKIPYARSSTSDGLPKHGLSNVVQLFDLGRAEPARQMIRMETGAEQNFVGVNVADSRHDLLLHE